MLLQRRYSVTGQTPPDNPHPTGLKSPKLQALDTGVQAGGCGLCDGINGSAAGPVTAPGESFDTSARTSSKRSATQLPSPVIMSNSHELPNKIARLGIGDSPGFNIEMQLSSGSASTPEFPFNQLLDISTPTSPADSPFSGTSTPDTAASSPPPNTSSTPPSPTPLTTTARAESYTDLTSTPALTAPILQPRAPPTFETLPPEIRHQIYRHLPDLILPQPLIYCLSTFRNLKQHPLASVSRLVRHEALSVIYAYNTWMIKLEFKIMYDAFREWIKTLGDEGAGALRIVVVGVRSRKFRPRVARTGGLAAGGGNGNANANVGNQGAAVYPFAFPFLTSTGAPVPQNALLTATLPTPPPAPVQQEREYCPPDGDASFRIDLSERFEGGKVELYRYDGSREAAEEGRQELQRLVKSVWEKRCKGQLRGRDWVELVETFLGWSGWWL